MAPLSRPSAGQTLGNKEPLVQQHILRDAGPVLQVGGSMGAALEALSSMTGNLQAAPCNGSQERTVPVSPLLLGWDSSNAPIP